MQDPVFVSTVPCIPEKNAEGEGVRVRRSREAVWEQVPSASNGLMHRHFYDHLTTNKLRRLHTPAPETHSVRQCL